jgi:hypothetical protein
VKPPGNGWQSSAARRGSRAPLAVAAALALALLLAPSRAGEAGGAAGWWRGLDVRDLHGAPLNPGARWIVVIFLGQECPVSNAEVPVLNALSSELSPRGFAFVGAYVDPTADLGALQAHARDFAIAFPTADDRGHRLARAAGASYTPEAAVFSAEGARLYLGRIDDRVGESGAARPAAAHQELRDVLLALAAGAPGPFKGVAGYGCAIPEDVRP